MEIPVLNRISDFEAGISSLQQNPSNFIPQTTLSISGIARVSHAYTFWKWGGLLLIALVATFSGLVYRIKLFVLSFRRFRSLPDSKQPLLDYESDADTSSSCSCSSDEEDDEEEVDDESTDDENWRRVDDDFRVRGSGHYLDDQWESRKLRLRHRRSFGDLFSWSDIAGGKSVVKLWDNLGFGFDHDGDEYGNVISLHDMDKEQKISSFFARNCDVPAVSAASPPLVVSAGANNSRNIELKVWDRRVSCRIPAVLAEWHSQSKKIVNFNASGLEKFFVRGGGGELTVGDLRKANAPLENVTELETDTWWDADAVIVTDDFFDTLDGGSYDSAVARCCDAVRSHLLLGRAKNM